VKRVRPLSRAQQAHRVMRLALGALQNASIAQLIAQACANYNVDPALAMAIAQRESGLNPNAVSPSGAQGVMQLMPATAAALGVTNPFDPAQNIDGGVRYLAQMIAQFNGDLVRAVAAYDWGPTNVTTAVNQFGANWFSSAPAETQAYVQNVLGMSPEEIANVENPPLTIDAATGQPVEDSTDVSQLVNITPQPTAKTYLVLGGLALGAYLLNEWL
jgi:hypothetical protein